MFNPENNYSHPLFQRTIFLYFARTLETIHCVYTMYFADISTSDVMLFQKSSYSLHYEWHHHCFRKSVIVIYFFRVLCFFETSSCIHPFKGIVLIRHSSCSYPFFERPLFYCKIAAIVMHSFKFSVFFYLIVFFFEKGSCSRRYCSFQLSYQL